MNRVFVLLILLFTVHTGFAQRSQVSRAEDMISSGDLGEALETINQATDPTNENSDRTFDWPRTWEVRGDVYRAIFRSEDARYKALAEDPLEEAFASYKNALELDENNRNDNAIKIKLTLLINDLTNQAVQGFNSENYLSALESFEQIFEIQEMELLKADNPDAVDTVLVYNAALAAQNAGLYDKAIQYFADAIKFDYNGATTYALLSNAYLLKGDTLSALETLKEGFEEYPGNTSVLTSMIQIYLDRDNTEDAMEYLTIALEKEPNNATYHFAIGTLHEKTGDEEAAIEAYRKAISLNESYFDACYNLGALYYNRGVRQLQVANDVPASENEHYKEELEKANEWFKESLPYLEKCNEINPGHYMTLESLKNLYYRLQMMDKYNEVLEKIE